MVGMRTDTLMLSPRLVGYSMTKWSCWSRIDNHFVMDYRGNTARSGDAGRGESSVRRVDGGRRADRVADRVEGLQSHPGVDHDGLLGRVQLTGLDQLAQAGDRRTAGGLGEDPLGAGQ